MIYSIILGAVWWKLNGVIQHHANFIGLKLYVYYAQIFYLIVILLNVIKCFRVLLIFAVTSPAMLKRKSSEITFAVSTECIHATIKHVKCNGFSSNDYLVPLGIRTISLHQIAVNLLVCHWLPLLVKSQFVLKSVGIFSMRDTIDNFMQDEYHSQNCRAMMTKGMVFRYTWVYSKEDTMAHTRRLVVTS